MSSFGAPVVFLVFNRPELTARVFARIREARPERLFVVADGPRADRFGEAEKCRHVREGIEQGVDWPCEVIRDYSDVNLGCGKRVASGITHAFEVFEEAIVLEDDCLPDPTFFPFCAELLERYRNNRRVAQIGGVTFRAAPPADGNSYYFSRYPHCWGWATWRRAWQQFDPSMAWWACGDGSRSLETMFPKTDERNYWRHAFDATLAGRIDSWDYQWTASIWANGGLSVLPGRSLVANIGFCGEATHTRSSTGSGMEMAPCPAEFPLRHPAELVRDEAADAHAARKWFRRPSWTRRAWEWIGRRIP